MCKYFFDLRPGTLLVMCLLASLFLASCAEPRPPDSSFLAAERAIALAVEMGADEYAPVEMRFARSKLAQARTGIEVKDYGAANFLIEQSEISSELAIAQTRAAKKREKLAGLNQANEQLRQEFRAVYGEEFE